MSPLRSHNTREEVSLLSLQLKRSYHAACMQQQDNKQKKGA